MQTHDFHILRPDVKGRITLGKLAEGVSSFHVMQDMEGRLILEPYTEIPLREQWLFQNKKALAQVKRGLREAEEGSLSPRGDFSRFAED